MKIDLSEAEVAALYGVLQDGGAVDKALEDLGTPLRVKESEPLVVVKHKIAAAIRRHLSAEPDKRTNVYNRDRMPGAVTLYRFYDAEGRLLYVGITNAGAKRISQHAASQPWWPAVAEASFEHFQSRAVGLVAEADAIENEKPLYNIARPDADLLKIILLAAGEES